jgi:hypothetical protein
MLFTSRTALAVLLLSSLIACGGGGGSTPPTPTPTPPTTPPTTPPASAPVIASFSATPAIVNAGQSFTLSWNVTGATALSIDQGVGVVTGASSKSVSAAAGVTYTLSATNAKGTITATTAVVVAPPVSAGTFPILYVTQTPVSGFASRTTTFGNHLASAQAVPRGGDLMIRYPDGALRNLTKEAGFGASGFQGNAAIAVREPAVHWSGSKALFSMVVGSPASQYEVRQFQWQIYEVSGLEKGATARIVKVAQQPAYNNVSPFYGSDERVLFTSDRPRSGEAHLYPQLDEYESFPIVTGIWSLDPASGNLRLLNHTVSGAFSPSIDSFGRVIFTRWDHLQQDQQADADRAAPGSAPNGAFLYADETAGAARRALANEVFPEPRSSDHPDNVANNANGHTFNHFMPWQLNEDGTSEETLNHVGRHEFGPSYIPRAFNNDSSLLEFSRPSLFVNRVALRGDGGLFHMREDPLHPGLYYGTHAREFGTASANQIVKLTGSPNIHPESMVITAVTHPDTAGFTLDGAAPSAGHSGMYRNPLPMSDGTLVAVHTSETRLDKNDGTRAAPRYRYQFRLTALKASGASFTADRALTGGTRKALWYWDPDTRVDFDGNLWELDPVEVAPRPRPARRADALEAPERAVLLEESVDEAQLRAWLASNDLALIVTRDNTSRDQGERQQPFNLRVPGGVSKKGDAGKVYDVSHLQLFQADQIRGYGGMASPRPGRRPLAQVMHDPKVKNPANPGAPAGSVKLGLDGSSAAFVPARRAMTWQLTDGAGKAVVRERNWLTFQPGEIRTCVSCHGLNTKDQAGGFAPINKPEALRALLRHWKQLPK